VTITGVGSSALLGFILLLFIMDTKKQTSPALIEFTTRVSKDLLGLGWTLRDDGYEWMPDDVMESDLGRAIAKHALILESDDWKKLRIEAIKRELEVRLPNVLLSDAASKPHTLP
jgi:hypothetical protein